MILTILYTVLFFLFTIPAFFGLVILWIFTFAFDRKRIAVWKYSQFWSRYIYRICPWWKVSVEGVENIQPNQPYLIVSNHQHMLDIPLLLHLPLHFRFVSKREVYKIPIFGFVLWMRADVAIDRGGTASAKKMVKDCQALLRENISVAIFPEGTRSRTGKINTFHSGAFLLAKRGGVPMLPVVINGNFDAFPGGKFKTHHKFTVQILPPVTTDVIQDSTMDELRDLLETQIKQEHATILCQN